MEESVCALLAREGGGFQARSMICCATGGRWVQEKEDGSGKRGKASRVLGGGRLLKRNEV